MLSAISGLTDEKQEQDQMAHSEDYRRQASQRETRYRGGRASFRNRPLNEIFDDWEARLERGLSGRNSGRWLFFGAGLLIGLILG